MPDGLVPGSLRVLACSIAFNELEKITRVVARVNREMEVIMKDPDVVQRLESAGFRTRGGSGLAAIWWAASVMPYDSTSGAPNTSSISRMTCVGMADDEERMKRSGCAAIAARSKSRTNAASMRASSASSWLAARAVIT